MMNQPKLSRKEWNMLTMMLEVPTRKNTDARLAVRDKILRQLNKSKRVNLSNGE